MSVRIVKTIALSVLLATTAGTSFAATQQAPAAQTQAPQSVSEILQFQRDLRLKLESPTGEYSRFDSSAIHRMETAQDKVFRILGGVTSLDQLTLDQKVDVSNSLDEVKAILLANEDNRMICHRERKTGTNLLTRRCETVAQREANIKEANTLLNGDLVNGGHGGH